MSTADALVRAATRLSARLADTVFHPPVAWVYHPLVYASRAHAMYLRLYADGPRRVVFVGMNPGPWGMAQTGVPFGDVDTVRTWLRIDADIGAPEQFHPARPVLGLACRRVEVSGRRLWGLMRERFREPGRFFRDHFVANYCPLLFLDQGGRNLTPDRLSAADRERILGPCDAHLSRLLTILDAAWVVGVGNFAAERARAALEKHGPRGVRVGQIPHPSPASPAANRGWARQAEERMVDLGIWKPRPRP